MFYLIRMNRQYNLIAPNPSAVAPSSVDDLPTRRFSTRNNRNNSVVPIVYTDAPKKRTAKHKSVKADVDVSSSLEQAKQIKWEPLQNWRLQLDNIRRMRPKQTDLADNCNTPQSRYELLIGLMLSPQTKDTVTEAAVKRLRKHGMKPEHILATDEPILAQLIYPVAFYKNKAKYILKATRILTDDYAGDIPSTYAALLRLPGVGPKVANICMQSAWQTVSGIVVDTHVHRVANRLQWTPNPTTDANLTRLELEKWLPETDWQDVGDLFFWFGQNECTQAKPHCATCLNRELCSYANTTK